jgi:CheY-like chemotaxis protein
MVLKPKVAGHILEVLHIEDNLGDVVLLKKAVKEAGFPVHLHSVDSWEKALVILNRQGQYSQGPKPDVILLDLNLPKKDGMTILVEMRQNGDWKHLPVIILTSSESDLDREWADRLQVSHFVTKPMDPDQYGELLKYLKEFWIKSFRSQRRT